MTTQRLTAAAALHLGIPMTEPIDAKIARLTQMRIDGEDGYGNEPFRAALRAELAIPQPLDSETVDAIWESASDADSAEMSIYKFAALILAAVRPCTGEKVTDAWQEINSMNLNDDLVWLRKGNNIDGPRPPEPEDYDRYEFWVLCESPSIASTSTKPAQQPLQDAKYAERYRWLREQPIDGKPGNPVIAVPDNMHSGDYVNGDDADQAIDAAIASQKGTQ